MGKGFFVKLALSNLKRNHKKLIPYFIAATIMISVYFMVVMIMYSPGLEDIPEHMAIQQMFKIGFYTLNIFIAEFLRYINSFLIKQRKKELGLYGILGLEKRHVGYVMLWENLILNGAAVLLGIITGCVFGWMIFMLLLKTIRVTSNSQFVVPPQAFIYTLLFCGAMFLLISIINIFKVRIANPIDLLKSDHQGEKKKRFLVPYTIVGLVALGYAYSIALRVTNPIQALNKFFFAVVLVIFASYILFNSGSIVLLRMLKKNSKYYYQPDNFVSIAGMFHRMKQHANGLATICILSSMVLVTVSTCVSLYIGQEEAVAVHNKDDVYLEVPYDTSEEQYQRLEQLINETAGRNQIKIENEYRYFCYENLLIYEKDEFRVPDKKISYFEQEEENAITTYYLLLDDYNRLLDKNEQLEGNELILLSNGKFDNVKEVIVGAVKDDKTYSISSYDTTTLFTNGKNRKAKDDEVYLVLKDYNTFLNFVSHGGLTYSEDGNMLISLNVSGSQEKGYRFSTELQESLGGTISSFSFADIFTGRARGYSLYGGLLFLGAFFTILFLCATVLIIYFKQISEGYDDKERFETLQKVGMDDLEVKRTINKQILIVFFLPLLGALLHVAMASNMIIRLLEVFWLYNVGLTVLCIISSCFIFTIVYIIVYRLTAVTYCRIVKW